MNKFKIVLLYAYDLEGKAILENFENPLEISKGVHSAGNFLIYKTGVGKSKTKKSLKKLFNLYPVNIVFSLGTAGALDKNLKIGQVITADKIINFNRDKITEEFTLESDFLVTLCIDLKEKGFKIKKGTLVTVDKPLLTPDQKEEHRNKFDAVACDMESAVAAEYTGKNNLQFYCLRIISDTHNQIVPDIRPYLNKNNKPKMFKIIAKGISNPILGLRLYKFSQGLKKSLLELKYLSKYIISNYKK